mmetsp:Transcript_43357/g.68645  ORF Transcript_43357/g.68645 Transcript_43357/m.68645 type:complete len:508 (+) Transcript_43357:138-1661(+)|eukprot:CAMPEP_0169071534 /NCGR_PEP_ID=MMETSP1015-20121227/5706_1 /TAXON_ID=342587 /ORGANISM="Karlodinium micrum, Strain CCMP2283" /LENGTH=507 /DNA_ID=CAMNT_0009130617 /DNA_START=131 /DNA_END=1654 /DNA_ORIENTATION=-
MLSSCCPCFAGLGSPPGRPLAKRKRSYVTSERRRMSCHEQKIEEVYECQEVIGHGAFGVVRKVVQKKTGKLRVMKHCEKAKILDVDGFMFECSIQADLDHPHICRVVEVFQDALSFDIVMELCNGGDFSECLEKIGCLEEAEARCIFEQIMYAVAYMHSSRIVHRDLKPENFLLKCGHGDEDSITKKLLKLTDFGFARPIPDGEKTMKTILGTPPYMAPELWNGPYDEKVDVWSSGVILYEILCGVAPFGSVDDDPDDIFKRSARGKLAFAETQWQHISGFGKLLVHQCLKNDPDNRASAQEVMRSSWLEQEHDSPLSPSKRDGKHLKSIFRKFSQGCIAYETQTDFYKAAAFQIAHNASDKQMLELRQMFEEMDTEKNGFLTVGEIQQGLEEFGVSAEDIKDLFERHGKDAPDSIQYTEFVSVMMGTSRAAASKDAMWEAFRTFDVDGDRHLNKEELKNMLSRMEEVTDEHVEEMLNEVDTKHQGFIDFDEFFAYMQKAGICVALL